MTYENSMIKVTNHVRKTPMMRREEQRLGKPLEVAITESYGRTQSMVETANELGIKLNTLYVWILKLGLAINKSLIAGGNHDGITTGS